eukprot:6637979-Lingulodinium_polyedra.AAC.1
MALLRAGMPAPVFRAYAGFHRGLQVHFALSGGLGQAHTRRRGIPQGCPWSMACLELLLQP